MGRLLVCFALAVFASPAAACLNDGELPTHEREFRSQYGWPPRSVANRPSFWSTSPGYALLLGAGGGLLAGAAVVTLAGRRARG